MKNTDPRKPVFDKVVDKMRDIECHPTFEALRDVEFIRESGATNMFDTNRVLELLIMSGCDAGAAWISTCKRHKRGPFMIYNAVLEKFEKEHGVKSTWITPELRKEYWRRGLEREKRLVEAKLRALDRLGDSVNLLDE